MGFLSKKNSPKFKKGDKVIASAPVERYYGIGVVTKVLSGNRYEVKFREHGTMIFAEPGLAKA